MSSVWWGLPAASPWTLGSVGGMSINGVGAFLKYADTTFCLITQPHWIGKVPWMPGD